MSSQNDIIFIKIVNSRTYFCCLNLLAIRDSTRIWSYGVVYIDFISSVTFQGQYSQSSHANSSSTTMPQKIIFRISTINEFDSRQDTKRQTRIRQLNNSFKGNWKCRLHFTFAFNQLHILLPLGINNKELKTLFTKKIYTVLEGQKNICI